MHVRRARSSDLLEIARLVTADFWQAYDGLLGDEAIGRLFGARYSPTPLRRRLLEDGLLVAQKSDGLVGFVEVVDAGAVLEICAIDTAVAHRRQGVGRALVAAARGERSDRPVVADVMLGNLAAEGFFERLGFVPGEVVLGSRFDAEIVERRWWLESSRLAAASLAP